jgi:hypothetical protein
VVCVEDDIVLWHHPFDEDFIVRSCHTGVLTFNGDCNKKPMVFTCSKNGSVRVNIWKAVDETAALRGSTWYEGRPEGSDGYVGFVFYFKDSYGNGEVAAFDTPVRLLVVDKYASPIRTVCLGDAKKRAGVESFKPGVMFGMVNKAVIGPYIEKLHAGKD